MYELIFKKILMNLIKEHYYDFILIMNFIDKKFQQSDFNSQ